jgi:4-amino-4-deoxy-L-arabinose transferase-like glycosyltransferase
VAEPRRGRPGSRWPGTNVLMLSILVLYALLGLLYAVYTPDWQAPDEPAHYNYVRYLAEQHRFPVLKPGDFPAAYLEEIKEARFPPEMSIAPIRYEFHQPPLYYLLLVPVYRLFGGALLPLRLASLFLGGLALLVLYWSVQVLAPGRSWLALGTTAMVAFLPMHLALSAAVNNDALAELLLAVALLLVIRYLKPGEGDRTRLLVLLGVTSGLALLTKSSLYILLPFVLLAVALRHLWLDRGAEEPASLAGLLGAGTAYLLPAVGLALPWWVRNVALYGGLDILGLGRHDQVVVGQLRTAEFVAQFGLGRLLRDLAVTTFRSFWGQFGWMGVLLDQRLYQGLAVLTALAAVGLVIWAVRAVTTNHRLPPVRSNRFSGERTAKAVTTNSEAPPVRSNRFSGVDWQWASAALLVLWGLLTVASYLWYNTTFLQHQGRYLFRALLPIGLATALGWRRALQRDSALPLAGLFLAAGLILRVPGWIGNWPLLILVATAGLLAVRRFLPRRLDPLVQAVPYLVLVALALASLFLFVVPQLAA